MTRPTRRTPLWMTLPAVLFALATAALLRAEAGADDEAHLYVTRQGALEADTCASAWIIRRFVDPEARFEFIEPGAPAGAGTEFDTATADRYAREPGRSIADSIARHHQLDDAALLRVLRVVHDIEINTWGEKLTAESTGLATILEGLNRMTEDPHERLAHGFLVLDALYAGFGGELTREPPES